MKMLKTVFPVLVLFAAAVPVSRAAMPSDIQQANILQCFNWKFNDIRVELPRIAAAGFGAIQVSPVQGNAESGAEWFYAYLPNDLRFVSNANGTRSQLKNLCQEAETYGIKIIVDVVANHINPKVGFRDSWWDEGGRLRDEGAVNYNSRYSITHGNLGKYQDVNSELAEVQDRAKAFIEDLASIGVKGIRWDAAKHIGLPSEGCAFWAKMAEVEGLYFYGEVLDNPGTNSDSEWKVMREYTGYMSVTDNGLASKLRNQFQSGKMPSVTCNLSKPAADGGPGIPSNRLVYWGESHDEFANEGGPTKYMSQQVIDRVYLMSACRKDAAAVYLSRPLKTGYNDIKMGVKGSTDMLDNAAITAVNNYRINTTGVEESEAVSFGAAGYYVNARKNTAAFIMLPTPVAKDVEVSNPAGAMPDGAYTDVIGGGSFTVAGGNISGHVGATGAAVIYVSDPSSVTAPDMDASAPVEYYSVSGMRVERPGQGVYIRVQDGKRTKVVF